MKIFSICINKKNSKKKIFAVCSGICLAAVLAIGGISVAVDTNYGYASDDNNSETVKILFTNDVHANITPRVASGDKHSIIGYEYLAGLKQKFIGDAENKEDNVHVVSAGDDISGGENYGLLSKGQWIVDLMNTVGYTIFTPGNHEFDFGVNQQDELVGDLKDNGTETVSCNYYDVTYNSSGEASYEPHGKGNYGEDDDLISPYVIKQTAGGHKIAYVGITTPECLTKSSPKNLIDDQGRYKYYFYGDDDTGAIYYQQIQSAVDEAKKSEEEGGGGADYVIAVAHTGGADAGVDRRWNTENTVKNTNGIDLYLDGHSHRKYCGEMLDESSGGTYQLKNKSASGVAGEGEYVPVVQTAYEFEYVGDIEITFNAENSAGITTNPQLLDYDQVLAKLQNPSQGVRDAMNTTATKFNDIKAEQEELVGEVIGSSDVFMSKDDKKKRETVVADFCCDAYKWVYGADCAMINCGGIRQNVYQTKITKGDMINVNAFGNELLMVETSGQNIVDALEFGVRELKADDTAESPIYQVSGISYQVDLSKDAYSSNLTFGDKSDDYPLLLNGSSIQEIQRRVSNVKINGEDINLSKNYKVAGACYVMTDAAEGLKAFSRTSNGSKTTDISSRSEYVSGSIKDYEALIEYVKGSENHGGIDGLNGKISKEKYSSPVGNIILKNASKSKISYLYCDAEQGQIPEDAWKDFGTSVTLDGGHTLAKAGNRISGWKNHINQTVRYNINDSYSEESDLILEPEWSEDQWRVDTNTTDIKIDTQYTNLDGSPVKPKVELKFKNDEDEPVLYTVNMLFAESNGVPDYTLVEGFDYTVKYENNTQPGIATLIVIGNEQGFTGTKTANFEIVQNPNTPSGDSSINPVSDSTNTSSSYTGAQTGDNASSIYLMPVLMIIGSCAGYVVYRKRNASESLKAFGKHVTK